MRWGYLVPRAILALIIWVFLSLGFDPLLRRAVVSSGQRLTRARIDVNELSTAFFPPRVRLRNVRMANRAMPGTNLFKFDELQLQLSGRPLMYRSCVIDRATLHGIEIDTSRADSGLVGESSQQSKDSLIASEYAEPFRRMGQGWLDDIIELTQSRVDPQQLETYAVSEQIHEEWKLRFEAYETRVGRLEQAARRFKQTAHSARQGDAVARVELYRRVATEMHSLLKQAGALRQELTCFPPQVHSDLKRIDEARQRDQQHIRRHIEAFRDPDPGWISASLLGPELASRFETIVDWLQTAQNFAASAQGVEPVRMRGADVLFARDEQLPGFLVRKLEFGGRARIMGDLMQFRGTAAGITSAPPLHARPLIVDLYARGTSTLHMTGTLDLTTETPLSEIRLECLRPTPNVDRYGNGRNISLDVSSSQTSWQCRLRLAGRSITGELRMQQPSVTLALSGETIENDDLRRLLQGILDRVRDLDTSLSLSGPVHRPRLALRSSLGTQLAAGLRSSTLAELHQRQQSLAAQIDAEAQSLTTNLTDSLGQRYVSLLRRHDDVAALLKLPGNGASGTGPDRSDPRSVLRSMSRSLIHKSIRQAGGPSVERPHMLPSADAKCR